MSIFEDYNYTQSDEEKRRELLWDLLADGEVPSPYAELLEYDGEVNNGGHFQYFANTAAEEKLSAAIEILRSVLPDPLRENLERGFEQFSTEAFPLNYENWDEYTMQFIEYEGLFNDYDTFFYDHEELLWAVLKPYVDNLEID